MWLVLYVLNELQGWKVLGSWNELNIWISIMKTERITIYDKVLLKWGMKLLCQISSKISEWV